MQWLQELIAHPESMETTMLVFSLVIALGIALGSLRFRGIRLGVAGVLFSGLLFGHFGLSPEHSILTFAREFGLVMFVFAVGLSVGPGFLNALRRDGLRLNVMAASVVVLGVLLTLTQMTLLHIAGPVAVGIYCGATTNTPSLAAAGQALRENPPPSDTARSVLLQVAADHPLLQVENPSPEEQQQILAEVNKLPGMSYAVSYPGGVFGIICAILLLRWMFGIDPAEESKELERQLANQNPALQRISIRLTNPNLIHVQIGHLPAFDALQVFVSRVLRGNEEFVAQPQFELQLGDILSVVGKHDNLQQFCAIVGEQTEIDPVQIPSPIQYRWVTVSRRKSVGVSMEKLQLGAKFGVQITRIRRAETEMPPLADVTLSLGDQIRVVGLPENIARVAHELGDSVKELREPQLAPVFVGIALGVLVGTLPLAFPGVPAVVKLGLAGGPLLIAIGLSHIKRVGTMVWYLPHSANQMLKELGIAMFLASVGLKSGDRFIATFLNGSGFLWMLLGAVLTLVPLLLIGLIARFFLKERFAVIVGVLAGSMTDPPALAFANALTKSEVASVSYATVYPLSMMLRVISAQLLMMWWANS